MYTEIKEKSRALGKGHFSLYLRGHRRLVLFQWNIACGCKRGGKSFDARQCPALSQMVVGSQRSCFCRHPLIRGSGCQRRNTYYINSLEIPKQMNKSGCILHVYI